MISYSWILWLSNLFFMLIILLNFLIAIIGQSYDSVMSRNFISLYKSKCGFIKECTIITDMFDSLIGNSNLASVYLLSSSIDHDDSNNEWTGFIKTITSTVKTEISALKSEI